MNRETGLNEGVIFQKIVFIFLLLLSIHLWDIRFIPQMYNVENMLTWLVCGFAYLLIEKKDKMLFRNAIFIFIIGLIINAFAAYLHFDQSPYKTILSFSFYYFILIYFLLHYLKLSREYIEKVIIFFANVYAVLYLVQYTVYPFVIFKHDALTAQGGKQFEILGHGFLMLAYFLMLNRFLIDRKLKYIIMAIGYFMVFILCDFRTLIVGGILVTLVMIVRLVNLSGRDIFILTFVVLMFFGASQLKFVSNIVQSSYKDTQANFKEGKKYIRLVQLEFFFKRYPRDLSYFIIGGGKPSGDNLYNFNMLAFGQNYNIVWVDIGLLGFYIVIGAIAAGGLLWYTLRAIFIKLPRDRLFLSSYFLYLLIVSFTNEEIYRDGIFCVHAVALYLIDLAISEKSEQTNEIAVQEG